jgi:hypothetical protein
MPRLEQFRLTIRTGEHGRADHPRYEINGFQVDFDDVEGNADAGQTLVATGRPRSFPHSLTLVGPEDGQWDIERIEAVYECGGSDAYTVRMGAVTLDDETNLNIWHEPPLPTFDV